MIDSQIVSLPTVCSVVVLLMVAITIETRTHRIPNWLTLLGLLAGFALAAADGLWSGHLTGMTLGLLLGVIFYSCGAVGAGFAKLLAAVGMIIGPLIPVVTTVIVVAFLAYLYVVRRFDVPPELEYEDERQTPPFVNGSPLISVGTVLGLLLLLSPWS